MTKEELAGYCRADFEIIEKFVGEIRALGSKENPALRDTAALAALIVSSYTGMERVVEKLLLFEALTLKEGADKHSELLKKGFELGILPHELYNSLTRLLAFKEYFNRAYVTELNMEKLYNLASKMPETAEGLKKEVFEYIETV